MSKNRRIGVDRVALFAAWEFFRARIRQQRLGGKTAVQRSLLPMLTELLSEVKDGFECEELWATVERGRVRVHVRKANGQQLELTSEEKLIAGLETP